MPAFAATKSGQIAASFSGSMGLRQSLRDRAPGPQKFLGRGRFNIRLSERRTLLLFSGLPYLQRRRIAGRWATDRGSCDPLGVANPRAR